MGPSRCLPLALSLLLVATGWSHGDDAGTWNSLHITPATPAQYVYPYDGRAPKIAVLLHNHDDDAPAPAVLISAVRVNGAKIDPGSDLSGAGPVVIGPLDVALPSLSAAGVWDGRYGTPPAVGETKTYHFEFDFTLAPGAVPYDDDSAPVSTLAQDVQFTNFGETPALGGANHFNGVLRFATPAPSGTNANPKVEVASPYSAWLNIPLSAVPGANATAYSFSQALPARNDLYLRYSAEGYQSQVVWLGLSTSPAPPLDLTLSPAMPLELDYRRATAIATPTGYWRGAASDAEGTFVVFPGQSKWTPASDDSAATALRRTSRIAKYRYDGTKLWEISPGWEIRGGDMSADGRYVAYAPDPTPQSFHTPTENTLVLLDGATGNVLWSKSATIDDPAVGKKLDALEVRFSADAKWLAVGARGTGQVTLIDRATGEFVWSTATDEDFGFGAVTRLCFSPDGRFLYCGSKDGGVRQIDTADGNVVWRRLVYDAPNPNGLTLSSDGAWLAVGSGSGDASVIRSADGSVRWQTTTEAKDAVFSRDARYVVTDAGQIFQTLTGAVRGFTHIAGAAEFLPDGQGVLQIGREFQLFDLGGKLLKTFPAPALAGNPADVPQWVHLSADGRYVVALARDILNPPQTGIVIYERVSAQSSGAAPSLTSMPLSQSVARGRSVILNADVTGTAPLAFQWQQDGVDLVGAQNPCLCILEAADAHVGNYTVRVTNSAGTVLSAPAALAIVAAQEDNPARLANLSVSATVGAEPLTVGCAVGGAGASGTKRLLIRGVGPALAAFQVPGPLPDPMLTLFSGSNPIAANDNWSGDADIAQAGARVGAFGLASASSADAAMIATLGLGSFSVQLGSHDGRSGTGLAEIYDATDTWTTSTPRLINLSARAVAGAGNVLTAGFVVAGPSGKTVLVRGVGPSLAQFGVTRVLSDPKLILFSASGAVASNDDWYQASNALQIATSAELVGAFALDAQSHDAALLITLPPGIYTAQVTGAASDTGDALVEVYEVP